MHSMKNQYQLLSKQYTTKLIKKNLNENRSLKFFGTMEESKMMGQPAHKFYLLRHGETDANASGVLQGSSNFSRLTDLGRKQASNVATGFFLDQKLQKVDSVFVSPLSRSRDTLAVIENELSKEFQGSPSEIFSEKTEKFPRSVVLSNLREIDLYDWEGKHKSEVEEKFPRSYKAWIEGDPENFRVNDADQLRQPLFELFQRARKVWNEIHQCILQQEKEINSHEQPTHISKTCLIVSHGSLGQALLGTAFGQHASFFRSYEIPNCGVIEIEWDKDQFITNEKKYDISQRAKRWRLRWPQSSEWKHHLLI